MELANLNNVSANTLRVGQVLKIPSKSGTNPNNLFMYTVVSGDTIFMGNNEHNRLKIHQKKMFVSIFLFVILNSII